MRHIAIVLTVKRRKKSLGFVPVLYVEEPGKSPAVMFLGAQNLTYHKDPGKRVLCGERKDAVAIAQKFAEGYNILTMSKKAEFVSNTQYLPAKVRELLLKTAKNL